MVAMKERIVDPRARVQRFLELVRVEAPIVLAPMAGPGTPALAIEVSRAGGLGSLPCGTSPPQRIAEYIAAIRAQTRSPLNVNFFCHAPAAPSPARESAWKERLAPYYRELGLDAASPTGGAERRPFDETTCALVEELRPEVVSFHFGLPERALLDRVKATGAIVLSTATTVDEARWLEERGAAAIIAQGYEAGGHRGMFLSEDLATQKGTFRLLPEIVDAVSVPVVAAGGIADARGIAAALALGASAVQIGTAYLHCPEANLHPAHRAALAAPASTTAVTNVYSGRPARGVVNRLLREVGPIASDAPPFPRAADAVGPLRAAAEARGSVDFTPLWAGEGVHLGRALPAAELTRRLIDETRALLAGAASWLRAT